MISKLRTTFGICALAGAAALPGIVQAQSFLLLAAGSQMMEEEAQAKKAAYSKAITTLIANPSDENRNAAIRAGMPPFAKEFIGACAVSAKAVNQPSSEDAVHAKFLGCVESEHLKLRASAENEAVAEARGYSREEAHYLQLCQQRSGIQAGPGLNISFNVAQKIESCVLDESRSGQGIILLGGLAVLLASIGAVGFSLNR